MSYDAKDLYKRWAVSKSTILGLRARLEVTASTHRDKDKEILVYERKMLSNEGTAKKLADQAIEISRLKVDKYALVKKLRCSGEVKKEVGDAISAEYKLLLETNN